MTAIPLPPVSVLNESQEIFINDHNIIKNLAKEFETPKLVNEHLSRISNQVNVDESSYMRAYLRIRPFTKVELKRNENQNCMDVMDDGKTLNLNPPANSNMYKANSRGVGEMPHTFMFSKIFTPGVGQKEFFDKTALPLVEDFIEGQNSLLFTYGVTSSGKTYTIQGSPGNEGIMPRSIDVIFNSIGDQVVKDSSLQLTKAKTLTTLSDKVKQLQIKKKLELLARADEIYVKNQNSTAAPKDSLDPNFDDNAKSLNATENSASGTSIDAGCSSAENSLTIKPSRASFLDFSRGGIADSSFVDVSMQGNVKFIMYVSYIEIYKEMIYDLLQPLPKGKKAKRDPLKLAEDRNIPFVKGVKQVQVNSREEVFKLLTVGRDHLQMASTKLNHNSSRSHCIFTIKIVCVEDIANPTRARISQMVFCDLAGSERTVKTQSAGDRLKEAAKINTSLMTLGKCIGVLRYNQQQPTSQQRLVPYRESRLTQLFQSFLVGHGRACMVINANMCASLFDENAQVLKFSAVASQIKIEKLAEGRKSKRVSTRPRVSVSVDKAMSPIKERNEDGESEEEEEDGNLVDEEDVNITWSDIRAWEEREEELITVISMIKEAYKTEKQKVYEIEAKVRRECQEENKTAFAVIKQEWEEESEQRVQDVVEEEYNKMKEVIKEGTEKLNKLREKLKKSEKLSEELDDECMKYDTKLEAEYAKTNELTKTLEEERDQNKVNLNDAISKATEFETDLNLANEIIKAKDQKIKNLELKLRRSSRSSSVNEREQFIVELQQQNEDGRCLIQDQLTEINELRSSYEEIVEQKNEEKEIYEKAKVDYEKNISKRDKELEKFGEEIAKLQDKEIQNEKEKNLNIELKEQLETMETEKTQLEKDIQNYKDQLSDANTKIQENNSGLEVKIKAIDEEIKETKSALNEKEKLVKNLEIMLKNSEEICDEQKTRIENLESDLTKLKQDFKNKEEELAEMSKELKQNEEIVFVEMSELKSKAEQKSTKNEKLVTELNEAQALNEIKASEIQNLKEEVDRLKEELLQKSESIKNLENKHKTEIKELQLNQKELQKNLRDSEKVRTELKKDSNIAARLESQLMSEVERLQKEMETLKSQKLKVVDKQEEKRQSQAFELEQDISILTSEREDFKETIKKLTNDLEKTKKEKLQLESKVKQPGVKEATELEQLKTTLNDMETKQAHQKEINDNLEENIQIKENENNDLKNVIEEMEKENKEINKNLKQIEKSLNDAENSKSDLTECLAKNKKQIKKLEEMLENSKKKEEKDSLIIKERNKQILTLEKEVKTANQSKESELKRFREGRDKISASLETQINTQKSFTKVLQERLDQQILANENLREEVLTLKKGPKKRTSKTAAVPKENQAPASTIANQTATTTTIRNPIVKIEMLSPPKEMVSPIIEEHISETPQTPMETVTMANLSTGMAGTPLSSLYPQKSQAEETASSDKPEKEAPAEPPKRGRRPRGSKPTAVRKTSSRKKRSTAIQNRKDTPVANEEDHFDFDSSPKKPRRTRASKQIKKVVVKQEVQENASSENDNTITNDNDTDVLDDSDLQRATGQSRGFPKPSLEIDVTPQLKKTTKGRKKAGKAVKVDTDTVFSSTSDIRDRLAKRLKMFEFQSEVESEKEAESFPTRGRSQRRNKAKVQDGDNISLGKNMSRMKDKLLKNSPISQVVKRIEAAISPSRSPNISSPQQNCKLNDVGRKSARKVRKLHPEDISSPLECTPSEADPPFEAPTRRLRKRK